MQELIYREEQTEKYGWIDEDGYFQFPKVEIEAYTSISLKAQTRCCKKLEDKDIGIISTKLVGMPACKWYKINHEKIDALLEQPANKGGYQIIPKGVSSKDRQSQASITPRRPENGESARCDERSQLDKTKGRNSYIYNNNNSKNNKKKKTPPTKNSQLEHLSHEEFIKLPEVQAVIQSADFEIRSLQDRIERVKDFYRRQYESRLLSYENAVKACKEMLTPLEEELKRLKKSSQK